MYAYLLQVTLCWTLIYAVFFLFLRKLTFFNLNRWYLLSGMFLGLLLPLLAFIPIQSWLFKEELPQIVHNLYSLPDILASNVENAQSGSLLLSIVRWLYLIGLSFFLARFFQGLKSIYRLFASGKKETKNDHTLVYTKAEHLPFSFFHYVFISESTPLSADLNQILHHELTHVRSRHTVDVLLAEVISIAFWFHPLVYLFKSALSQTHEYLADAAVLKETPRKAYGQLLVNQALSGIHISLVNHFFNSHLKNRINMMYQKKSSQTAGLKYAFLLPVIAVLALGFVGKKFSHSLQEESLLVLNASVDSDTLKLEEEIFKVVEKMPLLEGCQDKECSDKKLIDFVVKNITYPIDARQNGIQGRVFVQFVVEKNGKLSDIKIARDIGGGCGDAAMAVVHKMNEEINWIPGNQGGEDVRVSYVLPITFKMAEDIVVPSSSNAVVFPPPPPPPAPPVASLASLHYDSIFNVVDKMPLFDGCQTKECSDEKFLAFLMKNLKYPAEAIEKGIEGRAFVQFVVEKNGSIGDIRLARGLGHGINEASIAVIEKMNEDKIRWTPGMKNGINVRVLYTAPITFKLSEESSTPPPPPPAPPEVSLASLVTGEWAPLFVIDGVIMTEGLAKISPDDIENVRVFKGDSAIEKYGAEGKNGVVEVTLKSKSKLANEIKKNIREDIEHAKKTQDSDVLSITRISVSEIEFEYSSEENGQLRYILYSSSGQLIRNALIEKTDKTLRHFINADGMATGIYYLVVQQGPKTASTSVAYVK